MDKDEQEEILHRLDERTEYIHNSVNRVDKRLNKQQKRIDENRALAEENETKIAVGAYTGGALVTAIIAKLTGLFPW